MAAIHCFIADTLRHIDAALRIRFQVFGEELHYIHPSRRFVPREVDPFDTLDTTVHLLACVGGSPAGVARILAPNKEVARNSGTSFGVDLESKFDLSPLAARGIKLVETMRYCVLAEHRGSAVASALHAAAVRLSLRLGITHWIGCANTETDSLEDARRIQKLAADLGFEHGEIHIEPLAPVTAPSASERRFSCNEREPSAKGSRRGEIPFPRTLMLYARRMGARFIGPPIYDARFRMCSMPVLIAVGDQRVRVPDDRGPAQIPPMAA